MSKILLIFAVIMILFSPGCPVPVTTWAWDIDVSHVQPLKYAMLGDSLTAQYRFQDHIPGLTNYAIGGSTVETVTSVQLPAVLAAQPDVAFVMVGINNIYSAGGYDEATTFANYTALIEALRGAGIKVYVLSILPVVDTWRPAPGNLTINSLNTQLKTLGGYVEIHDSYSPYVYADVSTPYVYNADGLHLTQSGYKFYCEALFANVAEFK